MPTYPHLSHQVFLGSQDRDMVIIAIQDSE